MRRLLSVVLAASLLPAPTWAKALSGSKRTNALASIAEKGIAKIEKGNFRSANRTFAKGLRLDPESGSLHFLNALAYHLRSLEGDSSLLEKAEAGYAVALRYDPANHHAAYLLGQVYFAQRRYEEAENQFSYGLLYAPEDPSLLRALSTTAYYTRRLDVARWAADRAESSDPQNPATWRASLFASAAVGDLARADKALEQFRSLDPEAAEHLSSRLQDWKRFHKTAPLLAQFSETNVPEGSPITMGDAGADDYDASDADKAAALVNPSAGQSVKGPANWADDRPAAAKKTAAGKPLPKMALVDVVILRSEEGRAQSKGVNLLSGLKATLTGTLYAYNRVTGFSTGGTSAKAETRTIAPTLALSGLQYNLDIFNDENNKAEILARPSLLAVEKETSKFFSGSTLHVQLNSNNSDGSLVDVPVGIHLNVTPKFLDDETLQIQVHAERNFIESNDAKLGFSVFSQTAKTSVDATAVLKFGDTLILSGLSENENNESRSGVPFLQRIPIIQYLFSRKVSQQTKKSILILLSPHKARTAGEGLAAGAKMKGRRGRHLRALRRKENIVATQNIDAAYAHITLTDFYRQFRSGDLRLDFWHDQDSLAGALKRAAGFLYY